MRLIARDLSEKALAIVLGLFLLLALFRGGNTDLAMKLALVGGIVLLGLVAAVALLSPTMHLDQNPASLSFIAALLTLLLVGAMALVPDEVVQLITASGTADDCRGR